MTTQRIFDSADWFVPASGDPLRTVVTGGQHAVVVTWHVEPGQRIAAHVHPAGQDVWIVLAGSGLYRLDAEGTEQRIRAGQIAVAPPGAVHGVFNDGEVPLQFVSVVAPEAAGYAPL